MALNRFNYSRPKPRLPEYGASVTRPGQGFTPGEWMRRLQAGTAQAPPPGKFGVVTSRDVAEMHRMDLDLTDRAKMVADRIKVVKKESQAKPVPPSEADTTEGTEV